MKSVYECSTALDAHMILNLLEQEGIRGRVDGEYLPGGVGELQAINLVRVMVDEADYERAGQVIREWEAIRVEEEEKSAPAPGYGLSLFFLGLIIGSGLVFWAYNTPVGRDSVDRNGDGVPDEKWIYRDNRLRRVEVDRNLDGKVDVIVRFDRGGLLKQVERDEDFDGDFESGYTLGAGSW
ncbi:MAG: DUF2007 domain-containing protein [Gammaproteobacteria bacterium]|jgi:hypothetical protein